jgi:hypothetical protein
VLCAGRNEVARCFVLLRPPSAGTVSLAAEDNTMNSAPLTHAGLPGAAFTLARFRWNAS